MRLSIFSNEMKSFKKIQMVLDAPVSTHTYTPLGSNTAFPFFFMSALMSAVN
jgi:hypothetical protein